MENPEGSRWPSRARELLTQPSGEARYNDLFRELYPPGGIEEVFTQIAGQPCLLQHLMNNLVARLNIDGRQHLTSNDIQVALDQTVTSARVVVKELWNDCDAPDQAALETILQPDADVALHQESIRQLRASARGLILKRGDNWQIRTPLFQRWMHLDLGE